MPKIRKKTSKRTTTHMREKVKRKVSDSHKKAKKIAKKDVTWKSNKPKDIGIPAMFPYKDQLLAEAAADKLRAEEEKLAKREAQKAASSSGATLASTAALAAAMAADSQLKEDQEMLDGHGDDAEALVIDASLKLHAKSLRKVLEASDVIVEVLDARDPVGTRCRAVERELKSLDGGRKKLVLVLNKIDLVPPPVVQAWLAHLRLQAPTLPFKSSTQQQRNHLSASSIITPTSASGSSTKPLLELIKGFRLTPSTSAPSTSTSNVKTSLTIGVIGHPNVGKSSLINTLKRSKACSVAPTPGWTKEVQEIGLEKGVRILDCPGVVVEAREESLAALRGLIKPEDVTDPRIPVNLILDRCKKEHLMMLYNIPFFNTPTEFLVEVARGKGRLRKGGIPDLTGTARSVLRDWVSGRIPYYTSAPPAAPVSAAPASTSALATSAVATTDLSDLNTSTLLTSFAPAFDLAALFGEADLAVFTDAATGSAGGAKGAVRMDSREDDAMEVVGWAEEEEKIEVEEEDDGLDIDDLLEDDDEEDNDDDEEMIAEDEAPVVVAKTSTKTKKTQSTSKIVSVAPTISKKSNKSVSFAVSNTKELMPEDVGVNKGIKNKAKKEKKLAAKAAKVIMEVEKEHGEDAAIPSKPRAARVVKGSGMDVEFDAPYDFAEFFPSAAPTPATGGKKSKKAVTIEDLVEQL